MQIITGLSSNLKRLCCNDLYAYHIHAIAMRPTGHCTSHCQVSPFAMGLYGQKSVMQRKGDWTHRTVTVLVPVTIRWVPSPWDYTVKNQLCNARAIGPTRTVTVIVPVTPRWVPSPCDYTAKISYATQGRLDPSDSDRPCTSHYPVGPFAMG